MNLLLKVTLLCVAGGLLAAYLSPRSAALRHLVWVLTLTGALGLAIVTPLAPAVPVRLAAWPIPAPGRAAPTEDRAGRPDRQVSAAANPRTESPASSDPAATPKRVRLGVTRNAALGALWLVGALMVAAWYGLGRYRLALLLRRSRPLESEEWTRLLTAVSHRSGITAPVRMFRSAEVGSPLTWGMRRPVILLPDDADSWTLERRRVVLAHELAHVARGDYLTQLIACIACALYWFHPLVWMSVRRLRVESERACDDHVLVRGTSGVEYAAHLLDVARQSRVMRLGGGVAIGMARPSHLEGRLLAVLDEARPRTAPASRARAAAWASLALVVFPLAALTPSAGSPSLPSPVLPRGFDLDTPAVLQGDSTFDRTLPAKPNELLELDLETGAGVELRGWDEPKVRVRAHLAGQSWADTRVTIERTEGGVRVHAWQAANRRSSSTSHRLEIQVPRQYDVHIKSSGGRMTIVDVEGIFDGETGGGGYEIEHSAGAAHLSTGGGDVKVSDSHLRGSISTGGGVVVLSRVTGGLRGSSGSGPVIYSDGKGEGAGDVNRVEVSEAGKRVEDKREPGDGTGMLHITKAGGSITLPSAPSGAEVSTGGGDVRIGSARGFVSASTGGGNVEVGPVAGSVEAGTGAGTVHVWISDATGGERLVDVTSGNGQVFLDLPQDLHARFDLETGYTNSLGHQTRIDSDWELSRSETSEWDDTRGQTPRKYVRARGSVGGGGPLIRVRTTNGNITVRRRAP